MESMFGGSGKITIEFDLIFLNLGAQEGNHKRNDHLFPSNALI